MSKSKRPRHPQRVKAINVPMQSTARDDAALDLHSAVDALIRWPSPEAYNRMSAILATLVRCEVVGDAINVATAVLVDICDRYERVGKVGVSAAEAEKLRAASAGMDAKIGAIPLNKFNESKLEVRVYVESVGAA